MRTTTSILITTTFLLLLSTFASAWPWPRFLPEMDAIIVRRQDADSSSQSSKPAATPTPTPTSGTAKVTGSNTITTGPSQTGTNSQTGSKTGSATGSGSASGSGTKTSSSSKNTKTNKTSYDPKLPVGAITMLQPPATAAFPIYKIGDYITFGFNYTNVLATPTALNVLASCDRNKETYTIAVNATIKAGQTGQVVWDTNGYATNTSPLPLVEATYTVIIYDAEGSANDASNRPGYLAPYTGTKFGIYEKKDYGDDIGPIQCATCSGALSSIERSALTFVFGMGLATVLGFTWFVNGLDVVW